MCSTLNYYLIFIQIIVSYQTVYFPGMKKRIIVTCFRFLRMGLHKNVL